MTGNGIKHFFAGSLTAGKFSWFGDCRFNFKELDASFDKILTIVEKEVIAGAVETTLVGIVFNLAD